MKPALLVLATLIAASPLRAQWYHDPTAQAYFVTGEMTFAGLFDPAGNQFNFNDILVGKDNRTDFQTLPGAYTLTLGQEFNLFQESGAFVYPDGKTYPGLHVFGNHKVQTQYSGTGALPYIWNMTLHDHAEATLGQAKVEHNVWAKDFSTLNVNGSWIRNVHGANSSKVNIESATALVHLSDNSEGTLTNSGVGIFEAYGSAKATLTNTSGNSFIAAQDSTVNFVSGHYGSMTLQDNAQVTMRADTTTGFLEMYENSVIHVQGQVDEAHIKHGSTLNIEGESLAQYVTVDDSSHVIVDGGTLNRFAALVDGTVTLKDGALEGYAYLFGESVLNLEGGTVAEADLFNIGSASFFNFFGQSLVFSNPSAGTESGYGYSGVFYDLAWTRADGTLIESRFFDEGGNVADLMPAGVTFTVVPEPRGAVLLMLGVVALGLRRRQWRD